MKKFLKTIGSLVLVGTIVTSNISTVLAYTSDELIKIQQSEKASKLYSVENGDLELFVTKSDANSTNASVIKYQSVEEYSSNGTEEGRRAGLNKAIEQYYEGKFPKIDNAEKALSRLSDATILKENKISESDENKDKFLSAYKIAFIDAYNTAEFQLAGYDFGHNQGERLIYEYEAKKYTTIPSVTDVYKEASRSIYTSYGVSKNDKYAPDFEKSFKIGFELGYLKESTAGDVIFNLAEVVGYETARRIDSNIKDYQDFEKEIDAYKNTFEFRSERNKIIADFKTELTTEEQNSRYEEGFDAGVSRYVSSDSDGNNGGSEDETIEFLGWYAGYDVGYNAGKVFATSNFIYDKAYDSEKAYNEYMGNTDVLQKYKIYSMPIEYIQGFTLGIAEGFEEGYQETYAIFKEGTITASEFVQLPDQGDLTSPHKITATSTNLSVDFAIDFGYGNFFDKSYVSVYDTGRYWEHNSNRYTAYSNLYNVEVYSEKNGTKQNYITLKEPVKITFTHEIGENVGVYKIVGGQLRYIHTQFDLNSDSTVSATIPAGKYYGGQYILLADEKVTKVRDITTNWNYQALNTYARRGWLMVKNEKANPETNITRAELAHLIERNMNKDNVIVPAQVNYADYNKFYGYDNGINYCVSKGYFTVNSDNKFRPTEYVTYSDLETVLTRALNYKVSFKTYSDKMKTEYFKKSKYESGKNNYVTRTEAVFVLYNIFQ